MNGSSKRSAPSPEMRPDPVENPENWHRAVDSLPEHVALLDKAWNIIGTNRAWDDATKRLGFNALRTGGNYRAVAEGLAGKGHALSVDLVRAMDEFDAGQRQRYRCMCPGEGPKGDRTYETIITASEGDGTRLYTITRHDLSELYRLKAQRRTLGSKLLRAQEEERRRIARDLHDSTAQLLVGLHLNMLRLKNGQAAVENTVFREIEDIIDRVQQEIRSFAFLAHPVPLEGEGLDGALRAMAQGLSLRTGVAVEFSSSQAGPPLPQTVQGAFYRLAQEALANIQRHAHARQARITLITRGKYAHLIVTDDGVGVRVSALRAGEYGVGVLGMRERLRELGGRLTIVGGEGGTTVIASVPAYGGEEGYFSDQA